MVKGEEQHNERYNINTSEMNSAGGGDMNMNFGKDGSKDSGEPADI
jgi:hypothetical protein